MLSSLRSFVLVGCVLAIGCGQVAPEPLDDGSAIDESEGEARASLALVPMVSVDKAVSRETRKLFTTASSFRRYFGVDAPIDFDRLWIAYFAAGSHTTGGYTTHIESVQLSSSGRTLYVTTRLGKPGEGCHAASSESPAVLVAFAKPRVKPTSTRYVKLTTTNDCDARFTGAAGDCRTSRDCGEADCEGVPADGSSPFGRCVPAPIPGENADCRPGYSCDAELACAGADVHPTGICVREWMVGRFEASPELALPDAATRATESSVVVRGLAPKLLDLSLDLDISHGRRGDLRVTLTGPDGRELVLLDDPTDTAVDLGVRDMPVEIAPNAVVNGRWTLRVTDRRRQNVGVLTRWGLHVASRGR